ncbi:hypothetical protein SAMN05216414_1145 [Nitrosovibrio sp. Nv17]|nr:hypothetical protein SAMN05216414_1145 [Nitrosovibrio sp. Nv17]
MNHVNENFLSYSQKFFKKFKNFGTFHIDVSQIFAVGLPMFVVWSFPSILPVYDKYLKAKEMFREAY